MNPISLIQNYREKYSVMNVPRNLKDEISRFNMKRKITDEELKTVLDKRIETLKDECEMWKEKNAILERELELIKMEKRIAKYEEEHPEWKEEYDKKEQEELNCKSDTCWCNNLKGKELEEAYEAYERSEV